MAIPTLDPAAIDPPIILPTIELPSEDGQPLESNWHRAQISLLIDLLHAYWADRTDYYVAGNMFVYYSFDQVRHRDYRGPNFFVVLGVGGSTMRKSWVVWEEQGRYPDMIVELLSPTTAQEDRTTKKALYEQTFRTSDYFLYDPEQQELAGYHLRERQYEMLEVNAQGWLWSAALGLWLGKWTGRYLGEEAVWLRFFDADGQLAPTAAERAEMRAEQLQTEVERLHTRLRAAGIDPAA
jgi:Uma2 family endonuclease